jgi:hypothetical protein
MAKIKNTDTTTVEMEGLEHTLPTAADVKAPAEPTSKYKVGYGKPPVATRWKTGQSGNPKGKKKGTQSLKQIFLEEANKKIALKNANGVQRISQIKAVMAVCFAEAFKGKPKMLEKLLVFAKEYLPPPAPETAQDAIDKLNEAVKACPGHFVMTPNHVEAIEGMRRLYGPGSDGG